MALENAMAFGVNEALKRAFPDDPATKNMDGPPNLAKPFLMVRTVLWLLQYLKQGIFCDFMREKVSHNTSPTFIVLIN